MSPGSSAGRVSTGTSSRGRRRRLPERSRRHYSAPQVEDSMRSQFGRPVAGYVLADTCLAGTANAQTASRSSAVASPTYSALHLEVTVNKPAAEVWKQFGGYCAVAAWMKTECTITSGKD